MEIFKRKLKKFRRRRSHINYMKKTIWHLKYEILNEALVLEVNKRKIARFHKYNRRLKLITFLR